jgi:hypothetical protein
MQHALLPHNDAFVLSMGARICPTFGQVFQKLSLLLDDSVKDNS